MAYLSELSGQKVVVTGASGFLGTHVCRRLQDVNARVYAVSRSRPAGETYCSEWLEADLTDHETAEKIIQSVTPDVIYHLSGYGVGAPDLENLIPTFRNDLATAVHVLIAATQNHTRRIVLAASLEEPQPGESSDPIPSSPYAAAKWAISTYARMCKRLYNTPVVMTRPFMTYGPGQRSHKLIPHVALSLLKGEAPKLSSGTRQVDFIYVDDVIDGMLAAAVQPNIEGFTFDLGSGVLVTIRKAIEQLAHIIGGPVGPQFGALQDRPMEKVRAADLGFAQEKLGWKPKTSLQLGLEKTVAWYRNGLIGPSAH